MASTNLVYSASMMYLILCGSGAAFSKDAPDAVEVSPAPQAPQLEDIVVTAQRRAESLQKVPVSVTAIGGEGLAARNLQQVSELGTIVPGLNIPKGSGVLQPFLRGIGNLTTAAGNESSVALYIDGVFYSRLSIAAFALANVDRVEVLKGPQGTLFGRNSSGGVIQVITKDPSHSPAMEASLGYGNLATLEGKFYGTTGLTDKVAVDLAVSGRWQRHGYGINEVTGNRAGFEDYISARSKLLFEPSDETRITFSGFYAANWGSMQGNAYPGTFTGYESLPFASAPIAPVSFYNQRQDLDSLTRGELWGATLRAEHDFDFARLTSISAYSRTYTSVYVDGDYTPRPDSSAEYGGPTSLFTQELQLSSIDSGPLEWVAGLYYYHSVSEYDVIRFKSQSGNTIPPEIQAGGLGAFVAGLSSTSQQKANSYAAYGQATYEVLPGLRLTGGLRYTRDDTSGKGSILIGVDRAPEPTQVAGPPNSFKDSRPTYKAAISYEVTPDIMAFGAHSYGYKVGVFNLLTYNPVPNRPELVKSYEVGLKTALADQRVRLNIAAFLTNIRNPQTQLATNTGILFSNAGGARTKGIELEATALVAEGLTVRASGTYMKAKYTDYANAVCAPINPNPPYGRIRPAGICDATGNYLPRAPKFSGTIGVDYHLQSSAGEWDFNVDLFHNGSFYFQPSNDLKQKGYDLVSAQVKYSPTENYSIRLWGRNLLGEKYADRADENPGPSGSTYMAGRPRTYGVAFDLRF